MSDISKINPNSGLNVYDLKDSICRTALTVSDPTEGDGIITFGVDADGNYGYKKVGADTVTPFKSGSGGVSEFGSKIAKTSSTGGYALSPVIKNLGTGANQNIDFSNTELDNGIWILVTPIYSSYPNVSFTLKNTNDSSISIPAISDINATIVLNIYTHISMFKIDNPITINCVASTIHFERITSSNYSYFTFIKLQ